MDKHEQMRQMVDKLNTAAEAYYNGKGEIMTDYEWDQLFDQLKALEKETGIVLEDSPTNNVSADNTEGQKEEHEFAALSLAKTKKTEEKKAPYRGFLFGLFLVLLFGARFLIEFFKLPQEGSDAVAAAAGRVLNNGQLLSIPFVVAGIAFIVGSYIVKKPMLREE